MALNVFCPYEFILSAVPMVYTSQPVLAIITTGPLLLSNIYSILLSSSASEKKLTRAVAHQVCFMLVFSSLYVENKIYRLQHLSIFGRARALGTPFS